MIIVDRIKDQFVYTVVDQHQHIILETSDRNTAVLRDKEINNGRHSEFIARVNWLRTQNQA